jgi:putative membrane protein
MMWSNGMGWGGWIVMTLTLVAFWSLVVFAAIAIFRGDRESRTGPRERDPEQILDERFARGDIEAEEYHARRNALRGAR